ncbi:hypothetical protein SK128_025983, partial [Halocaridina rubra]
PATAGMTQEGALLLTVPVQTAARVTRAGPLDAQPRICNAAVSTRIATTTDVARKRKGQDSSSGSSRASPSPRKEHGNCCHIRHIITYNAITTVDIVSTFLQKPTGLFRSPANNRNPSYLTITLRGLSSLSPLMSSRLQGSHSW